MPVTGFVKAEVRGRASGQNIRNILYYGNDVGEQLTDVGVPFLSSFGAEWAEAYAVDWVTPFPSTYTLEGLSLSVLDIRGNTLDLPAVYFEIDEPGLQASDTDTPAICAILKVVTVPVDSEESRSLKRSYLAMGPISTSFVGDSGNISGPGLVQMALWPAVVAGSVTVGFQECSPVRLGRTVAPSMPALGTILSASVQPFVSFRKSRKFRPNGT